MLSDTEFQNMLLGLQSRPYAEQKTYSALAARVLHYPNERDMRRTYVAQVHAQLNELAEAYGTQPYQATLCRLTTPQLQKLRLQA